MLQLARPGTKYTDRLAAQFITLVASGHLIADACAAIDCTPAAIHAWRKSVPGFDTAFEQAKRDGLKPPALPAGPSVARWEKFLTDARKMAPIQPAASV